VRKGRRFGWTWIFVVQADARTIFSVEWVYVVIVGHAVISL